MAGLLDFLGVPAGLLGLGGMPFDEQNFRQMQPGGMPDWMRTAPMTIPQGGGFGPDEASAAQRQPGPPMQIAPQMAPQAPQGAPMPQAAPQQAQGGPGLLERLSRTGGLIGGIANTLGAVTGQGGGGLDPATSQGPAGQAYRMMLSKGVDPQTAKFLASSKETAVAWLQSQLKPQEKTSLVKEYEYARSQGFTGSLMDFSRQKTASGSKFALQPIYGVRDGKPVVMQLGSDGRATESQLPDNVTLSKEPIKLDAGTHFVLIDPVTRTNLGVISKNVVEKAAQEKIGEAQGTAAANLPAVINTAEQSLALVDEMISHPGRETATGASGTFDPRNYLAGTDATNFRVRADQMQGRTFLEAFQALKGAGAITEQEGKAATQAIARLNTAQSDDEYRKALVELKTIIAKGVEVARKKAGGLAPAASSAGSDLKKKYGLD